MKKLKPFDFLTAINTSKENLMADPEVDPKDYVPFLTNRSLSYFLETVMYSNDMNMFPDLTPEMQFGYYLHSIRKGRRFAKWIKPEQIEDIELIQKAFGYNTRRAEETLKLLKPTQIEQLRQLLNVGGKA